MWNASDLDFLLALSLGSCSVLLHESVPFLIGDKSSYLVMQIILRLPYPSLRGSLSRGN